MQLIHFVENIASSWISDVDTAVVCFTKLARVLQGRAYQVSKKRFAEWLTGALEKGARAAHRWANEPNLTPPISTEVVEGVVYVSPDDVVAKRAAKWEKLWGRDAAEVEATRREIESLRRECVAHYDPDDAISQEGLGSALKRLPTVTGTGCDHWTSVQLKAVSGAALEELSGTLNDCEMQVTWPLQVLIALIPPIGKEGGGGQAHYTVCNVMSSMVQVSSCFDFDVG